MSEPFARGRDADLFLTADGRLLRRYRRDADVAWEIQAMAYVRAQGFPVPEVYGGSGRELELERLDGSTVSGAFAAGRISLRDGALLLADLLRRLHALPPFPGAPPGTCVLHLDLHPENIMLTSHGPVVIDWTNAAAGDADLDTAMSALIMAQLAVDRQPLSGAAGAFLDEFLAVVPGDPVRRLDEAVAMRAGQLTMTAAETALLGDASARMRAGL